MQLVRIEEDGAYSGLVGGSPRPRKGVQQQLAALPLQLDSRDARFVTELVSGDAHSDAPLFTQSSACSLSLCAVVCCTLGSACLVTTPHPEAVALRLNMSASG